MTSLKTSIKTITYLSDIGCLEIQSKSKFRIAGSLSVEKSISIASVAGADTLQSDRVLESLFTGYH